MNAAGIRPRVRRTLCAFTAIALTYACMVAPPTSAAAVSDTCGLITQFELSRALGLKNAVKHSTLVTEPGNPGGVVRNRCETFAWSGTKPTNEKRKRASLLAGTFARLNMQSWVPDEGPQAQVWGMRFDEALKRLRGAASELFLKKRKGKRLFPSTFGADAAVAFSATVGRTRQVRALWWNRNAKTLLVLDAVEAKGQPTVAAVKQVASIVASEFFR